jgi:hypothetical protein
VEEEENETEEEATVELNLEAAREDRGRRDLEGVDVGGLLCWKQLRR